MLALHCGSRTCSSGGLRQGVGACRRSRVWSIDPGLAWGRKGLSHCSIVEIERIGLSGACTADSGSRAGHEGSRGEAAYAGAALTSRRRGQRLSRTTAERNDGDGQAMRENVRDTTLIGGSSHQTGELRNMQRQISRRAQLAAGQGEFDSIVSRSDARRHAGGSMRRGEKRERV